MDLELSGKVAVVTGASKGIGLAVTRALVDEGARVVAGARGTDALDGIDGVLAVPVDLAAPDGPGLLVARAIDEYGRIDVLVNNVGAVRLRMEGFLGTSDEERKAVEAATPIGRWGGADPIARTVLFLVETDFVTGETIRVDGGRHVK